MTEAREAIARIIEPFAWGRYTDGLADQEPRDPILISSSLNKADAILALLNTSAGERDMTESEAAMVQKSYEASSPLVEVIGEQESPAVAELQDNLSKALEALSNLNKALQWLPAGRNLAEEKVHAEILHYAQEAYNSLKDERR